MRIVTDTNVLISDVFFCGFPREIPSAVVGQQTTACATTEMINEYEDLNVSFGSKRTYFSPLELTAGIKFRYGEI
ncbi:MAG: hypothetical protein HFG75_06615 [Hungatella sp.]|nr:hypothetical protein [Hungatella sp.]